MDCKRFWERKPRDKSIHLGSSELPRIHRDVCWPPRYLRLLSSLDLTHESTELSGVSFGRGTMNLLLRQSGCPGQRKFGNICCESEREILKHREGGCGWKLPEGGVRDGDGVTGQLAGHMDRRAGQGWAGREARRRLR